MSITSAFKGKNDYEVHFIGLGNITRWNDLKHKLQCTNNVLFISKLLDIALEYYYNHYSKEPIDIYKIDNDDIDDINLDSSPRSNEIVDEKPQREIIDTHDVRIDTNVNSDVKLCAYCDFDHSLLNCPLAAATNSYHVPDNVRLDEWSSSASAMRYSYASAPHCLKVRDCDANLNNEQELGTVGVFCVARNGIAEHVALGPLVGRQVAAATIAIDCDMRHMHTMYKNDKRRRDTVEDEMGGEDKKKNERTAIETIHISSDNDMDSNWVRHVRPSGTRAERNVTTVQNGERLYLVTVGKIQFGEELRYWDDTHDVIAALSAISNGNSGTKKKVERKTACGGCGLRFTHTLHYRQHCLLHHDTGRSLAMRKYHCLVCGVAVVGKERMRRHAQQAHQGRGAYQCQYCGKYFLRRNYLDMHRRYGCGRNPQRAKPLCDLCGKEFCQPQKLKVHIKRMHSSEMEDVLREFQCKRCMKLLGSRAALQRHVKEVHEGKEQVQSSEPKENGESGAIVPNNSPTCTKCGKQFQNKSNLKIHMLTHSGVKPFQCVEGKGCTAAFTTKQCLQFHYKRVHGYQVGGNMPRIERIIDYTLEAYSGGASVPSPPQTEQSKSGINSSSVPTPPNILSELSTELPIPISITNDLSEYNAPSTPPDTMVRASTGFIVSKGSKKWMIEQSVAHMDSGNSNNSDNTSSCGSAISLLVDEADVDDVIVMAAPHMATVEVEDDGQDEDDESDSGSISCRSPNHHLHHNTTTTSAAAQSASTASLLVEAALDSVCNTVPVTPTSQQHTPPPLSLSTLDTANNTGQQLGVDGRTPSMSLYGNNIRAGSVSPLLPRYGGGGGTSDNLALQLDLSIYKHYAATVVDTVVRKYGDGLSGGMRSIQQPTLTDIPAHQAEPTIITTPTDRYMRFLDNPLSLVPPRLDTNQQYSPTSIDCTNQQHLLDIPIDPTRGDSTANIDLLPLDTTKAKLDLSMSYYDTALEEIRTRLAAYEAAAVANDMGKGMAGIYGVEQDAIGTSGFLLDNVGEFRSFEPFVLQGGQSSPQGAGGSNADLQGLDMTSTGCRTNNITTQQYSSLSTTTITNNPSPCPSPGLTSYHHHHRFPPPPLHLNLDHHLQPPPRLYSPTLIDSTSSSAAAAAAVVVADLSLRHHVAAAAAHHHVHAHAHSHHDGVFSTSAYSHSPPPNAGGVPSLGYPPPPPAPSGVYHPHYPQYY